MNNTQHLQLTVRQIESLRTGVITKEMIKQANRKADEHILNMKLNT